MSDAVQKILRNKQITSADQPNWEPGIPWTTVSAPKRTSNRQRPSTVALGLFLRSLTGLDREAASEAFDQFQAGRNSPQQLPLPQSASCDRRNGLIDVGALWQAAFRSLAPTGPEHLFSGERGRQHWSRS